MSDTTALTERILVAPQHTTHYLEAGPADGPLLIFVHGWPALAATWRHQLTYFAARGYRVVAPDLRGYGGSTVYRAPAAYQQQHIVADMLDLLRHLGRDRAVWIGHDWGSPTVWNIAGHHPDRSIAVASLAIPYRTLELGPAAMLPFVNRDLYPADTYPEAQFDYMAYYEEQPERATAVLDARPESSVKALFRRGDPSGVGLRIAPTATLTRDDGWFGGASRAPDVPLDTAVLTEADAALLTSALNRNGFAGPTAYYLNHAANAEYAASAVNDGKLDLPVLFLGADYDYVADTTTTRLAEPMRDYCTDLTERRVAAGHWLHLEAPDVVNAQLADWLHTHVGIGPAR
jgi:pimeloyl-ACP methyl ester carboxylesterase